MWWVMARAKYGVEQELPKIQSILTLWNMVVVGVMAWACIAVKGTGSLAFIDDQTADGSS